MATQLPKKDDDAEAKSGCLYVKVSMDGAPYLRKVDLKIFGTYMELSSALEKMFTCFTISEFCFSLLAIYNQSCCYLLTIKLSIALKFQYSLVIPIILLI